jgi:hypothetical protein
VVFACNLKLEAPTYLSSVSQATSAVDVFRYRLFMINSYTLKAISNSNFTFRESPSGRTTKPVSTYIQTPPMINDCRGLELGTSMRPATHVVRTLDLRSK